VITLSSALEIKLHPFYIASLISHSAQTLLPYSHQKMLHETDDGTNETPPIEMAQYISTYQIFYLVL